MRRIGIVLLAALAGTGAGATSLERMSVERMTAAAPVVARVRCLANTARWEKGEIWTFTTFEVEERWKGQAPERIEVKQIGGRAGPVVSIVPGAPRFRPGEEAVLFLEPFYVGAGFAIYLNRRAELEAWDIEQEFRRAFFR